MIEKKTPRFPFIRWTEESPSLLLHFYRSYSINELVELLSRVAAIIILNE